MKTTWSWRGKVILITRGSKEVSQQNQGRGGEWDSFFVSAVWICFDINNLEPFFLIITGIIYCYQIKLMKILLAPDLEQVFHILPLGRQYLCLAPGTIAASWTVQVMKDCWDSLCPPAGEQAGALSLTRYIHCGCRKGTAGAVGKICF